MANEEHIEWLQDGVEVWNARRAHSDFKPDLSEAVLNGSILPEANFANANLRKSTLKHANLVDAVLTGANLKHANLKHANLTRANLEHANLKHANLKHAILEHANLTGANLTGANLEHAILEHAILEHANLTGANLTGANLADAILIGARLGGVNLSEATLFSDKPASTPRSVIEIKDFIDFVKQISGIRKEYGTGNEKVLYFRGERKSTWKLRPSIAREEEDRFLLEHERELLRSLISRRPSEFSDMTSALDKWMLAQHHKLTTRFLDITKNPLVALFYACQNRDPRKPTIGRLRVFAVQQPLIKQYDSDAIRVVANFASLSYLDQMALLGTDSVDARVTFIRAKERLLQLISLEKPNFPDWIDIRDLYRIFIVEPQQFIERIRVQSGAFLVSAFHKRFEAHEAAREIPNLPIYDEYELRVPKDSKKDMLEELSLLGITRETLFPGLDESARAVMEKYARIFA